MVRRYFEGELTPYFSCTLDYRFPSVRSNNFFKVEYTKWSIAIFINLFWLVEEKIEDVHISTLWNDHHL